MNYVGQFVVHLDGSPWIPVNSSTRKQAPPSPATLLFRHIFRKDGTLEEIKELLNAHTVDEIKSWSSGGHPMLHEACEQFLSQGAQLVLQAFFEDPRLKPLFTDRSYVDKHGAIATWRIARLLGKKFYQERPLPSIVADIVKEYAITGFTEY